VSEPGEGRVLLVDGLAQLAADNQWAGVVILGAIRDVEVIDDIDIGVQALGVCPVKTEKRGAGERDITLTVCEMTICPGDWLYADRNGVLIGPDVSL
jgi:regulator of ribonuclease activity A